MQKSITVRLLSRPRPYPSWMPSATLKPRHSQLFKLVIAWIEACANDPGHGVDDPDLLTRRQGGHAADCECGCMHSYLDVVKAELARELAKLSPVDRWLPEATSEDIRRELAERGVCGALLGEWDEASVFHAGLAGLSEQEARAVELQAEGLKEREIASAMDPKRARMFANSLSTETVGKYIDRGHRKLRRFFTAA